MHNQPTPAHINLRLAELAPYLPELQWVVLVNANGLITGSFPTQLHLDHNLVAAMSMALSALSERVAAELEQGALQYSLTVGANSQTLLLVLNAEYILTLGLQREAQLPNVLAQLAPALQPLRNALGSAGVAP